VVLKWRVGSAQDPTGSVATKCVPHKASSLLGRIRHGIRRIHLTCISKDPVLPTFCLTEYWLPTFCRPSPVARRSSLVARRPSLVARRSSPVARCSSLVARRSSLVARRSSLVWEVCLSSCLHLHPRVLVLVAVAAPEPRHPFLCFLWRQRIHFMVSNEKIETKLTCKSNRKCGGLTLSI